MVEYVSNGRAAARARRREAADVASFVRRLDWILIGSVGALVGYGLWAIAGITRHDIAGDEGYYLTRQTIYVVIGSAGLLAAVLVDPEFYRTRWRTIFGGTAFVIAIVFLAGAGSIRGSKRWLDLGFFRFQPSEFGKVLFILALAGFLAERSRRLNEVRTTATALGLASIPIFLVFLHPDEDPGGATYNITQSKNAVGAGQLRGRGVDNATQTTLNFLPEHHTDFVFASLAEERGFFGAAFLLMLYLLMVWRGLRIVTLARDAFSAMVAGGLVFALLFQIFVNVGMTMGIAPITGIPLPFVSVGGSSMIANVIAVGLLLSIHVRARAGRR